jgi:hypothetical protein
MLAHQVWALGIAMTLHDDEFLSHCVRERPDQLRFSRATASEKKDRTRSQGSNDNKGGDMALPVRKGHVYDSLLRSATDRGSTCQIASQTDVSPKFFCRLGGKVSSVNEADQQFRTAELLAYPREFYETGKASDGNE